MTGVGWIMTIILGGLAGWIAEKLMKAEMGIFGNIALGVVGAIVANALLGLIMVPPGGWVGQSIVAVIGACLLIYVYRAYKGRSDAQTTARDQDDMMLPPRDDNFTGMN